MLYFDCHFLILSLSFSVTYMLFLFRIVIKSTKNKLKKSFVSVKK